MPEALVKSPSAIKRIIHWSLPLISVVSWVIISRFLYYETTFGPNAPVWDKFAFPLSAALIVFNPSILAVKGTLQKALLFTFGFLIWLVALFFVALALIAVVFHDSL